MRGSAQRRKWGEATRIHSASWPPSFQTRLLPPHINARVPLFRGITVKLPLSKLSAPPEMGLERLPVSHPRPGRGLAGPPPRIFSVLSEGPFPAPDLHPPPHFASGYPRNQQKMVRPWRPNFGATQSPPVESHPPKPWDLLQLIVSLISIELQLSVAIWLSERN